ncbi:MAG: preprotein translocase subunit SecG [Bacteroidia bacterium]
MLITLIVIIIIACLLLWLVILVQNPKGGGISSQFGGSSVTNIIGAKQSVDVIEKATWVMGGAVVILVVLSSFITKPAESEIGPGIEGGTVIEESAPDAAPDNSIPLNDNAGAADESAE